MKLSVIIVSWNVKDKLKKNLSALFRSQTDFAWEVLVVDNNSTDGTVDMIKNNFPQVHLIVNQANLGFAKANNQALDRAEGEYVLLLNPDMEVFPDTLANLITWLSANPQAWVAGGRLVDTDGKIVPHVRRFPRLTDQLAIVLKLPHFFPGLLNKYLCKSFDYTKPAKVDSIRGSFFALTPKALAKINHLDERYFIWFEEVDYCRQVAKAGGEVWYTPVASAVDLVGQSFVQVKKITTQKYFRDSMLKYFAKWHPGWPTLIIKTVWAVVWPLVMIFTRLDKK